MPKAKTPFDKKQLKKFVNENGFFCSTMKLDLKKNAPAELASKVPEGATYFEGIVSNGELNRNGYIIRPKALIDSLATYMENPIILLQHDMEKPIGQNLAASLQGKENEQDVFVQGYIFDDMTNGAFSRGLLRALSTGHITKAVEFENVKTGEIMSVEDFRKLREEKGYFGEWENDWVMAVTALEWVEYSLVSIPSNRRAMITKKNAIEAYFKGEKFCENSLRLIVGNDMEEEESEDEAEKPSAETESEEQKSDTTVEKPTEGEGAENSGETPAATTEEPAEKSGEGEGAQETKPEEGGENKVRISKADREKLKVMSDLLVRTLEATVAVAEEGDGEKEEEKADTEEKAEDPKSEAEQPEAEKPKEEQPAEGEEKTEGNSAKFEVAPEIKAALETLVSMNTALTKQVADLKNELSQIPKRKGLAIVSQFSAEQKEAAKVAPGEALLGLLRENGFNV